MNNEENKFPNNDNKVPENKDQNILDNNIEANGQDEILNQPINVDSQPVRPAVQPGAIPPIIEHGPVQQQQVMPNGSPYNQNNGNPFINNQNKFGPYNQQQPTYPAKPVYMAEQPPNFIPPLAQDEVGMRSENKKQKQKKKTGVGYFISGFGGVAAGAIIVFAAMNGYDANPTPSNNGSNNNNVRTENVKTQPVSMDLTTAVTDAAAKVGETVVGISNIQFTGRGDFDGQEAGSGSGVIYKIEKDKAYIVTNYHVVEGSNTLEVTLQDGEKLEAELVGGDQLTDLAVIKVDAKNIKKAAEFGDSNALKQGEPVIAIGNPLGLSFSGSVTQGIVSGLKRSVPVSDPNNPNVVAWNAEVIQTDAAINPGNSGGALVNMNGQVIGINSMKISQSQVEGIGFAIPIDDVVPIINDLEDFGQVKRPYMGTRLEDLNTLPSYSQASLNLPDNVTDGVVIRSVEPGSPSDAAGIKAGDVVFEINGEKVTDTPTLRRLLYSSGKLGDTIEISFYRNGTPQKVKMVLAEQGKQG